MVEGASSTVPDPGDSHIHTVPRLFYGHHRFMNWTMKPKAYVWSAKGGRMRNLMTRLFFHTVPDQSSPCAC